MKREVKKETEQMARVARVHSTGGAHRRGPANWHYKQMHQLPAGTNRPRSVPDPNQPVARMVRTIMTSKEEWEATLLLHLAYPMASYLLPGIDTTGTGFEPLYAGANKYPGGRDTNSGNAGVGPTLVQPVQMQTFAVDSSGATTTFPIRQVEMDRQMESNHFRFDGHIVSQIDLTPSGATGDTQNVVIGFDPLDYKFPVYMIEYAEGENPWGKPVKTLTWTSSPYIVRQITNLPNDGAEPWPADTTVGRAATRGRGQRDDSSDRWTNVTDRSTSSERKTGPAPLAPAMEYDSANFYYPGGAEMTCILSGTNAFTSYSCLARDDSHTITRFWQCEDSPAETVNEFDYGSTVQYSSDHNVGYAAYTGSKWTVARALRSGDDPDAYGRDRIRFILNSGMPFIKFKYALGSGSSTTPYLAISCDAWLGVAPTTISMAGAADHRTVPLSLPAWVSYCRARGASGHDAEAAKGVATASAFQRIANAPSDSRIVNAVASDPTKAARTARKIVTGKGVVGAVADLVGALIPGGSIVGKVAGLAVPALAKLAYSATNGGKVF